MLDTETDEEIARRVQKGDTELFGVLIERYTPKMLRYARKFLLNRQDAEDLVQEVFLKAYVNIQGFDAERRFSPWLYRIAHNLFINAIKRKGREPLPFFDPDTIFPHPLSLERADKDLQEKELKGMLEECLDAIDPKYREPLVLYYFEDMNYADISDVLHIPVSTVGVRLNRGKAMMKKIFSERHII